MPTGCWLALHAASGIVAGRSTRSLDVTKMASGFFLYGPTATIGGPVQIKTGSSTSIAGFAAEDLALKFREVFGLGAKFSVVRLSALGTDVAPWPATGPRSNTVLLFDSMETLDSYAKDREHFPYSAHMVGLKGAP